MRKSLFCLIIYAKTFKSFSNLLSTLDISQTVKIKKENLQLLEMFDIVPSIPRDVHACFDDSII